MNKLNYEFLPVPMSTIKDIGLTTASVLGLTIKLTNGIGYCYPSNQYICRELQLSEPTVKRALKKLEEEKYIKRNTSRNHGKYDRKIYLTGKHQHGIQPIQSAPPEQIPEQPNTSSVVSAKVKLRYTRLGRLIDDVNEHVCSVCKEVLQFNQMRFDELDGIKICLNCIDKKESQN